MTDCGGLIERMPEVAHGRDRWSATDATHLSTCAECSVEWRLVQQGVALGSYQPAHLDQLFETVASKLRAGSEVVPITSAPSFRRRWIAPLVGVAAAAIAVIIWSPQRAVEGMMEDDTLVAEAVFPEIVDLTAPELSAVITSLDAPETSVWTGPMPTPGDLSEAELREVLRQMEEGQ